MRTGLVRPAYPPRYGGLFRRATSEVQVVCRPTVMFIDHPRLAGFSSGTMQYPRESRWISRESWCWRCLLCRSEIFIECHRASTRTFPGEKARERSPFPRLSSLQRRVSPFPDLYLWRILSCCCCHQYGTRRHRAPTLELVRWHFPLTTLDLQPPPPPLFPSRIIPRLHLLHPTYFSDRLLSLDVSTTCT